MKFVKYWLPTFIWMAIIFYFSSRFSVKVSDVFIFQFLFFKTLHILEYSLLYILMYRSLKNTHQVILWQNQYQAFLLSFMYAMTDEIHQVFVPTREGRIRDVAIDTIGITIAAIFLWKYLPKAPKILKNWAKKLEII